MAQDQETLRQMNEEAYAIIEDVVPEFELYVDKAYVALEKKEFMLAEALKKLENTFDALEDGNEHQLAEELDYEKRVIERYLKELRAVKSLFEKSFTFE